MRTYDFTPLYRATVGFDRMADLLDRVLDSEPAQTGGYPPYNIEKNCRRWLPDIRGCGGFLRK